MTVQPITTSLYNRKISNKQHSRSLKTNFASSLGKKTEQIDALFVSEDNNKMKEARELKEKGNNLAKYGKYQEAIDSYKKSLNLNPDFIDARYNLAKSYKSTGDYNNAIKNYEIILEETPKDIEVLTSLADSYKNTNNTAKAKTVIKRALELDPDYDPAKRIDKEIDNKRLEYFSPVAAKQQVKLQKYNNIKTALTMASKYFDTGTLDKIKDLEFTYDTTSTLSGHSNIAQYENSNKRVVVTDDYVWAAPEIVAAYLVHEIVHASDKDPYTSITEEQDAYRKSVQFWINEKGKVEDPEMDYAAKLYKESPATLDAKVAAVYSTRDSSIPTYSPNHGINAYSLKYFWMKTKDSFSRFIGGEETLKSQAIISDYKLLRQDYR